MSSSLPTRFRQAIGDDPGSLILWVGAGLSRQGVREQGKGLPGWHAFTERMIEHLENNARPNAVIAKTRNAFAQRRYLAVATAFVRNTSAAEFSNFMRTELDPDDLVPSRLHEIILSVGFRGIFTTNFDRVFERQHPPPDPVLRYPQCLNEPASVRLPGFLAKIHGCVTQADPNRLVLNTAGYNALNQDERYHTILTSYFSVYPVMTVGYSLRDPDFQAIVRRLRRVFGANMPPVFALMLQPEDKLIRRLRGQGVDVIPYEDRRQLVTVFHELLELAEGRRPSPTVRLSTSPLSTLLVRNAKDAAWESYRAWKHDVEAGRSLSPALGRINVTLKAWRHITRVRVPQREICHRLSLLPCAREVVEKAPTYRIVRRLGRRVLISLEGVYRSPYQADVLVEVIVEQLRSKRDGTTNTLLSVHERRYSAYAWKRRRDLSI